MYICSAERPRAPPGLWATQPVQWQRSSPPTGRRGTSNLLPPAHEALVEEFPHKRGNVTLSSDLLEQPEEFRARVIVEELLHLKVPNHGKLFKALLRSCLEDERDDGKPEERAR